jgi:hypothetical protein
MPQHLLPIPDAPYMAANHGFIRNSIPGICAAQVLGSRHRDLRHPARWHITPLEASRRLVTLDNFRGRPTKTFSSKKPEPAATGHRRWNESAAYGVIDPPVEQCAKVDPQTPLARMASASWSSTPVKWRRVRFMAPAATHWSRAAPQRSLTYELLQPRDRHVRGASAGV